MLGVQDQGLLEQAPNDQASGLLRGIGLKFWNRYGRVGAIFTWLSSGWPLGFQLFAFLLCL